MIYIETGSTDVYYNFGLENYFTVEKRLPDTVFLFWRTTPTLMVGKYQNILEEINKPYADAHGIHLVRRMSGGGTIYTDLGGWQFSFIQHREAGEIEFGQYIAPVIGALEEMGVTASFNGRNDLTIDGRKFSGNAQYRLGDCIVHHGPGHQHLRPSAPAHGPGDLQGDHGAPYHERQPGHLCRDAGGRRPHPGDRPGKIQLLGPYLRRGPPIQH